LQEMRPFGFILMRAILAGTMAANVLLAGCGPDVGEAPPESTDQTANPEPRERTEKPMLWQGAKNDEPVPDVVGMRIEAACQALERNGHAGEVSFIERAEDVEPGRVLAQDIEPATNKGASMLVYLTVSGPFSERELSPNTSCANPQPDIDDARAPDRG
jgi:hypothetical protein